MRHIVTVTVYFCGFVTFLWNSKTEYEIGPIFQDSKKLSFFKKVPITLKLHVWGRFSLIPVTLGTLSSDSPNLDQGQPALEMGVTFLKGQMLRTQCESVTLMHLIQLVNG